MQIGKRLISPNQPPFLVAEISCNHTGHKRKALELIKLAHEHGADAVKFQCYLPEDLVSKPVGSKPMSSGTWAGKTMIQLYEEACTPPKWFPDIAAYAKSLGITWFTSVFNADHLPMLEELECPAYKIASGEIADLELIKAVSATNKPLIMSTGMADNMEIYKAVETARTARTEAQARDAIALLHCVSGYPTPVEEANVPMVALLAQSFALAGLHVGLSDHSLSFVPPIMSVAYGAQIIEVHLRLQGDESSPDAEFSWVPENFETLSILVKNAWLARQARPRASEQASRQFRRHIHAARLIKSGEAFTAENICTYRSLDGLHPHLIKYLISEHVAARDIFKGMPIVAADIGLPT